MTEPRHATLDETHIVTTKEQLQETVSEAFNTVQVDPYAPTAWGTKTVKEFPFILPSGQKILLRKLDPIDLIAADLVDEMDYFSKKLFPDEVDRAGNPIETEEKDEESGLWVMLKDPEKREHFFKLMNGMAVAGVIKPALSLEKNPDAPFLSVHDIDFTDRMAIFSKLQEPVSRVGAFRQQSNAGVESVETSESL